MNWIDIVHAEFVRAGAVVDDAVVQELAQHAADAWQAARADGESPIEAEARVRALVASWCAATTGPQRIERVPLVEHTAPSRAPFGGLAADVRDALRWLRATPSFTAAAVVVLALGIGASTAIFSVVDAVVLRGLPFDEADRLVAVGERRPPGPADTRYDPRALWSIATPNYLDWVAQQQVFESIAVANVLADVPLRNISTMEEIYARRTDQRRLNMLLLGLFGLVGLVVSTVGLYGVVAYAVLQRTREIGVRVALGATQSQVVGMVLVNAGGLIGAGLLIGGAGAWYLSAIAQSFLFGVQSTDPRAFVAAFASLVIAGALASVIPARRAARIDPVVALRAE